MTDRELLEMAAKAAGLKIHARNQAERDALVNPATASLWIVDYSTAWNPLTGNGDALWLAVKLNLSIRFDSCSRGVVVDVGGEWDKAPTGAQETYERDGGGAATRRAIVRAAAEIGKAMP